MLAKTIEHVIKVNIKGKDYLYQFQNAWDPVKQRSYSKHRITLGRLIDGKVELGRKFLRDNPQYKDVELTFTDNKLCPVGIEEVSLPVAQIVLNRSEALNAGASYVLEQIAKQSGITKALKVVFPEHWKELLSLAIFLVIHPDATVSNYDVIAQNSLYPTAAIPSQRISEIFESIDYQPSVEQYLKLRLASNKALDKNSYWAFDTTSVSSFSQTIHKVTYGHNKEDPDMAMLKLALLIDEKTAEPLYYKVLDGSIADVVLLKNLFIQLAKLDAEDVNLVLDRGFCSEHNLQIMFRNHVGFVCGLRSELKIVEQTFKEVAGSLRLCLPAAFKNSVNCFCATREIQWYSNTRKYGAEQDKLFIHIYYSKEREADYVMNMTQLVESFKLRLKNGKVPNSPYFRQFFKRGKDDDGKVKYDFNVPAWAQFCQSCGFFFLGSDRISLPDEALNIYRQKDTVEKAFNNYKDRCGGRRLRCLQRALDGKVFVTYLALSLRLMLHKRMQDANIDPEQAPRLISELNALTVYKFAPEGQVTYLWHEIPKRYKELMQKLKIKIPAPIFVI